MKNMKKLVALFAATTMAMSLSVSAFAASYADGTLTLEAADFLDTGAQKTMMAYVVDGTTDAEGNAFTASTIPAYNAENHAMIALDQDEHLEGAVTVDASKVAAGKTIVIKTSGSNGSLNTILLPQAAAVTTYNVTYANVTDASYPATVEAGTTLQDLLDDLAALTAPTLEGYDFAYWSATENGERFTAEELADPIAADVTLYAVFTAKVEDTIKVTFMNGAVEFAKVAVVDGKVELPAEPTLDPVDGYATTEYTFVEWVTEDGTTFDATNVTADMTVYPKFKSNLVYGDVFADGYADGVDVYYLNTYDQTGIREDDTLAGVPVSHLLGDTVVCGDVFVDGYADGVDVYYLNTYDQTGIREDDTVAGMPIYVVNK